MGPSNNNSSSNKRKKAAVPLAPPPHAASMKSRKRARQVTTLFHKYTREKDLAVRKGADATILKEWDDKIEAIGGRKTYQEASQLSTSFHSTSKWVLGYLQRKGWLYGIPIVGKDDPENSAAVGSDETDPTHTNTSKKTTKQPTSKKKRQRRDTRLLEIGAINTELLDASERTVEDVGSSSDKTTTSASQPEGSTKKYRLQVRAIDLHSMHPGRIEEADFLTLSLPPKNSNHREQQRYDVIVCSMVLNCVTTAEDRGEMLTRIYDFLRPGGRLFLTIPKLCLTQSPFVNRETFAKLLGDTGVGFEVEETKESPKVSFFICHRPVDEDDNDEALERKFDTQWTRTKKSQQGKKYRNQFAVVLKKDRVLATRGED